MNRSFEGLGLESPVVATLVERGYSEPTPIQAALIPVLLDGRDAIGQAPTGTGKTAAFSLPIVQRVTPGAGPVQALVLAPTRELAIQVADTMFAYGRSSGLRVLPIFGGQAYNRQMSRLRTGVDVVVGTPGRLLDLSRQGALDLSSVATVVLDEADEMLSMGFIEDIEAILDLTPESRQTVLMSATMPAPIRRLATKYLRDAVSCAVEADRAKPVVRERAFLVNHQDKVAAITRLFEAEEVACALIFAKTRAGTEDLAADLVARGIAAEALHGNLSQDARSRIVQRLRDGGIKVLVGTDVAARGLDIDGITHVVNFELPADPEVYVHRIGRTARAGRGGDAITLYAPNETGKVRRIEGFLGRRLEVGELPTVEAIEAARTRILLDRVGVWIARGRCNGERDIVRGLVEEGGDAVEIAAAALRLARQAEFRRPVEAISPVVDRRAKRDNRRERAADEPRRAKTPASGFRSESPAAFERQEGMVAMALSAGRNKGVKVNQVVSTLARHGGLAADAIGRIWIEDRRTVVAVRESEVARLLGKTGELRVGSLRLDVDLA